MRSFLKLRYFTYPENKERPEIRYVHQSNKKIRQIKSNGFIPDPPHRPKFDIEKIIKRELRTNVVDFLLKYEMGTLQTIRNNDFGYTEYLYTLEVLEDE